MTREEIAVKIIQCPNLTLYARSLQPDDFEELLQRTSVRMLQSKANLTSITDFNSYAAKAIKNEFLNITEEEKKHRELINNYTEEPESVNELKVLAMKIAYNLPTPNKREKTKREIIRLLHEKYDNDILDMATDLNIHKTIIYRALKYLRPQIQFIYNQLKEI